LVESVDDQQHGQGQRDADVQLGLVQEQGQLDQNQEAKVKTTIIMSQEVLMSA
jgi:hypothetical protein